MTGGDSTARSRERHEAARIRKAINALVAHPTTAFRRTGDAANGYAIRSWWWDKAATDQALAETEACLALAGDDASLADQLRWHRHAIFWTLGRFAEAEADLLALNRPDCAYVREIGRPLGFIRKGKYPHETIHVRE